MSRPLRLVVFDIDGTLVDSQSDIIGAMSRAFDAEGLSPPTRTETLSIVGLSLPVAMARLRPEAPEDQLDRLVMGYKDAYVALRAETSAAESSPLYPGARDVLEALHAIPDVLLGVATGKSKRGLDKLTEAHGLDHFFVTRQVSDFHPSKPHPSMLLQAIAEAGVDRADTVMVGDTSFDMQMASAAGVAGIGVSWGYHHESELRPAHALLGAFSELPELLDEMWRFAE